MPKSIRSYLQQSLHKSLYNSAYSRALYTNLGIIIKEIRCVFHQFFTIRYPFRSLWRCFQVLFSALMRVFLGRSLRYSYAYRGEDRVIEGILKPLITQSGFYVEVGCNHPKFHSNTYGLYRKGWSGICIDANERLIQKYSLYRPNDVAVCALVSNEERAMAFYRVENDVLSTVDPANLRQVETLGLQHEVVTKKAKTLTAILQSHAAPARFDLLSIDAEEHDFEVLTSLDFNVYAPRLIVVEDEDFGWTNHQQNRFVQFLKPKGYQLVGYVLKNAYFELVEPRWPEEYEMS